MNDDTIRAKLMAIVDILLAAPDVANSIAIGMIVELSQEGEVERERRCNARQVDRSRRHAALSAL